MPSVGPGPWRSQDWASQKQSQGPSFLSRLMDFSPPVFHQIGARSRSNLAEKVRLSLQYEEAKRR